MASIDGAFLSLIMKQKKAGIFKYLKNIFESGELSEDSVVSKMETTAVHGKRYQADFYNLDAIIAVGKAGSFNAKLWSVFYRSVNFNDCLI